MRKKSVVICGVLVAVLFGLFLGFVIRNSDSSHVDGSIIVLPQKVYLF